MGIKAGDIRQCTWYGLELEPMADLDLTLFISPKGGGGIIQVSNTAYGNGKLHSTGKRILPGFDGGSFGAGFGSQKAEFLQNKQNLGEPGPFTLTLIGGEVYAGSLLPEGEISVSTGGGSISIAGRGEKLERRL